MREESKRIGKRARFVLAGNRFYSGIILEETEHLIVIKDKFGAEVSIGKASIVSMEVQE